jgi:steroid delta-isomerase-like uncharacterized protein
VYPDAATIASSRTSQEEVTMSAEQNKTLVGRLLEEVWNTGTLDLVDALLTPSFVRHGPPALEGEVRGPDGFKQLVTMYRTVFPDLQVITEGITAEGDTVVARWTARGTHRGEFMGQPPTGRPAAVPGVIIDRISESKIAEEWASYDTLSLLQQLGVIPAPGQAAQQ